MNNFAMGTIVRFIDSISEWTGSITRWFAVALVAVTAYDTLARYVFNAPTVWGYETSCMLGASVILLGAAYCLLHNSHVRVDIFYIRLSPRRRAIIDVLGTAILFFPLCAIYIKTSASWMWMSWKTGEVMCETFWYPPAAPFRTVVMIALCLFFLQSIAQFTRNLHMLIKGNPL